MSDVRNHNFEKVLREFQGRPEFEGMIIDYHQRVGGQLFDLLVRVLVEFGASSNDPYALMSMVVRIARKNSVALPVLAARLSDLHEQLEKLGRSDGGKWRELSQEMEHSLQLHSSVPKTEYDNANPVAGGNLAPKVQIGIITVREDEFRAVLGRMKNRTPWRGRNYYEVVTVPTCAGECGVAVCRCPEQGTNAAQTVTENLINDLDPPWILLVGIAGAVPDTEFTLGDVVVANRVHDFSITCAIEGRQPELDIKGGHVHRDVENLLAHLPAELDRHPDWMSQTALSAAAPAEKIPPKATGPQFYGAPAWRRRVHKSLLAQFDEYGQKTRMRVWVAANASSPTLMKSATLTAQWKESVRSIASIEMELIGAHNAVHNHGDRHRLLGIRGISDVVGYVRRPEWTTFACHSAATLSWALISNGLLLQSTKNPT